MKALIILVILALGVSVVVWKTRKARAEAELARRKSLERHKKQLKKAVTPELDMVWPVIIRPVSGKNAAGHVQAVEEPAMTAIEFEPSSESKQAAG
jgi:hypothetical protein